MNAREHRWMSLAWLVFAAHAWEVVGRTPFAYVAFAAACLGVVFGMKHVRWTAAGFAAAGTAVVVMLPWNVPNHFVLATLVAFGLALNVDVELRRRQAVWVLATVFALATLQKLLSPTWMDGSFIAMLVSTGGLGHSALDAVAGYVPGTNNRVWDWAVAGRLMPMQRFPGDAAITWTIVYSAIVLEALAVGAVATSQRWPKASASVFAVFLLGTALLRAEWLFLALIATLASWVWVDSPRTRTGFAAGSAGLLVLWLLQAAR